MAKFSNRTHALLDILGDRPVAYHPALAQIVGGAKAAIWVSQMLYWDGKGKKRGGWIYKTQREWQEETGLTRTEQETIRRKLVGAGFMQEKKAGVPCTLHYRLDYEALLDAAEKLQSSLQGFRKLESETCTQDCGEPTSKIAEKLQSIPEITQEITQETTRDPDSLKTETTEARLERLQKRFGSNPLDAMVKAVERGAGDETSFTVPAAAGGADPYADGPLTVWCQLIGRDRERLRQNDVDTWAGELAKVAEHSGADAPTLAWALRQWQRAIIIQANDKGRQVQIPGNIAWMAPNQGTLFAHKNDMDRGITAFLVPLLEHGLAHGLADLDLTKKPTVAEVPGHREEPPERMAD